MQTKHVEFYESGRYRYTIQTADPLGWLQTLLGLSSRPKKHTVEHEGRVYTIRVKKGVK